ncbi:MULTISPECIES: phenylacetate--CoA ligase family protein [Methanohalophilus]|jgi:phenylacetate-CoA ligase|uniref:Phenylacetate--CoA ligase family protein n=1 Tax=Methanohalophilus euhalobius TaxID=51203 RepID=A0A285EMI1_9EURY|nr:MULTISPECIES: phenylacetate--CoA ligase [Methanohalophilus]ODV49368.1 MAG: phenylacetate-CoA ligase [Methanohalophilus sp. 2-GBenrich]PQV43321.1 phenylacetate-CoA ligase [Methanohalophilus euhalobius]RNI07611.1 phenylacetate--CoA ligase family protein [Methanohalophilus euhalobius]TCL11134.1 phenylacetate-CoA ligase [Methanohalophilus euhalobius]SNY00240.1 phenylacetate-CoA ligase [Methanohalophilus euhalobius]
MKYWQPEYETMQKDEMRQLQLKRLKKTAANVYGNVPFYKDKFKALDVCPENINTVDDITNLPITKKSDLRANYPFGLFATPNKDVVRIHASSGTSGKPTVVGYTENDIRTWADMMARDLKMVGVGPDDVFQNSLNYGLFTGGLGFHNGAERLGAMTVPAGTGNTARQLEMMQDFGVTAINCTPSYALYLAETAEEMDILDKLSLRIGTFGGEPWSSNTRKDIEDVFGMKAYDSYGLSELIGPGVAFECEEQDGLHIWDDHFLVEVLDLNGEQVSEGEKGELVLTSLTKEAFPVIRYHTGDITRLLESECACGRTSTRISRIMGRADDMLIVRGINVFPSQIEDVLVGINEITDQFQILLKRNAHKMDEITVRVELSDNAFTGELKDLAAVKKHVENELKSVLNIRTNVDLAEKGTIPRTTGKAKRVVDHREAL